MTRAHGRAIAEPVQKLVDFTNAAKGDLKHAEKLSTGLSTMHPCPINGVVQRVGATETAFNYRAACRRESSSVLIPTPRTRTGSQTEQKDILMPCIPNQLGAPKSTWSAVTSIKASTTLKGL